MLPKKTHAISSDADNRLSYNQNLEIQYEAPSCFCISRPIQLNLEKVTFYTEILKGVG